MPHRGQASRSGNCQSVAACRRWPVVRLGGALLGCLLAFGSAVADAAADAGPLTAELSDGSRSSFVPLLIYCLLVAASSWFGGLLPSLIKLTHTRLQLLISLIGGLMLGVGLLHQLPHAVMVLQEGGVRGALDRSLLWMLAGLTAMFFLLRMFHFHQHDVIEPDGTRQNCQHDHDHDHAHDHDHGRQRSHDHAHQHRHDHDHDHDAGGSTSEPFTGRQHVHGTSWMGVAFGLSLHTLIDGLALAAHVQADSLHTGGNWLPGLGTFLGIVLHKPLDSLSITSLMTAGGWSPRMRLLVNLGYASLCPLGALLFYFGLQSWGGGESLIVGSALAFSAGVFVCIALSDLLPEVEFHSHDRLKLSAALLAGLLLSWAIGFLEPEHTHGGDPGDSQTAPDAAGDRHDHGHDHSHDHDHGRRSRPSASPER